MIKSISKWFRDRFTRFVIIDPRDNSVTFSRKLFNDFKHELKCRAVVHAFSLTQRTKTTYAFEVNPYLEDGSTILPQIQYNQKHRTIGFECTCPAVTRIVYEYDLPDDTPSLLRVCRAKEYRDTIRYVYEFLRPDVQS